MARFARLRLVSINCSNAEAITQASCSAPLLNFASKAFIISPAGPIYIRHGLKIKKKDPILAMLHHNFVKESSVCNLSKHLLDQ